MLETAKKAIILTLRLQIIKTNFMKTKLYLLFSFTLILNLSFGQGKRCGTMQNLEERIDKDPTLKTRMIQIEKQNQEWIEKKGLGFKKYPEPENNMKIGNTSKSTLSTNALCGYNNTYFTTLDAPVSLNNIVSLSSNCIYGGEYVRVNNLVAGRTYRISTIGSNNFDTQVTIYPAGGGSPVAFNDDWNTSSQSEIYFTPFVSGNYDILIDEYGCKSNQKCSSLQIELWYIPRPVITIPVVVHIIHNDEAIGVGANISDAQIQSQIDVLNEDFRRLNVDVLSVPAPFRGASADPLIQFCLAQQTPEGILTNGITRRPKPTQENYNQLEVPTELQCLNKIIIDIIIKPNTIWDRDKYLNIWVSDMRQLPPVLFGQPNNVPDNNQGCNAKAITTGYAQFPGEIPSASNQNPQLTDGVWIRTDVFGRIGKLDADYNLGRTTTHEVGHWLNLKHIWGDDVTAEPNPFPECSLDDLVIDTPLQSSPSYDCKSFPFYDNCRPSPLYPGIMFQNFMDYSNDNCLGLFTFGQSARMDSALFNQRVSLLTSKGCVPGTLGTNQNENIEFFIHPNPTKSKVFFNNSIDKFEKVSIVNSLGQEVFKSSFSTFINNQEVDMSKLPAGVYILKFSNQKTNKSVKIIKE